MSDTSAREFALGRTARRGPSFRRRSVASTCRMRAGHMTTRSCYSRDSDHHMRGSPLCRSLCDGHLLVLCILPCVHWYQVPSPRQAPVRRSVVAPDLRSDRLRGRLSQVCGVLRRGRGEGLGAASASSCSTPDWQWMTFCPRWSLRAAPTTANCATLPSLVKHRSL